MKNTKIKKWLKQGLSSKRETASLATGKSEKKALTVYPDWNIYRSCRELPLNRYIEISLSSNLSLLDRNYDLQADKTPSPIPIEVLINVWSEISIEFSELMDSGTIKSILNHKVELELMQAKLMVIHNLVALLREGYDEGLVELLRDMGFSYRYDYKNEASYLADLEKVLKATKSIKIKIRIKEGEVLALVKPTEEHQEKTLDDWENEKIILDDDAKFSIDWDKKTVYEFTQRHKNLIKKLKAQIKTPAQGKK